MQKFDFDIDIDLSPKTDKEQFGVRASIYNPETEQLRPHPSGYYIDEGIPVDPETNLSAIPYEEADELGFMKIDLLTNTSYGRFESKAEVLAALDKEPNWDMLLEQDFVNKLPHIANHFDVVSLLEPRSIEDLADVLSLIRPGKTHLLDPYLKDKKTVRIDLYRKAIKGMYFKKSHAIAYAAMIVCVMNTPESAALGIEFQ